MQANFLAINFQVELQNKQDRANKLFEITKQSCNK
jgi:hypothetical protein